MKSQYGHYGHSPTFEKRIVIANMYVYEWNVKYVKAAKISERTDK